MDIQKLIRHVSDRNSLSLECLEEITNRRGARMLKLRSKEEHFGLKIATDSAQAIAREASILQGLQGFTDHMLVDSNTLENRPWLLIKWIEGQSAHRYAKQIREQSSVQAQAQLLEFVVAIFSKVADLHALGYLHGDLQPDHFRIDVNGTVHLLDFALTHRIDENFDYPGALVHFSAPEVCRQQVSGRVSVNYDEVAELYSLASVAFFLITGQISPDYGDADMRNVSLEEKRKRIAHGRRHRLTDFIDEPIEPLGEVLEKCMSLERRERYRNIRSAINRLQK